MMEWFKMSDGAQGEVRLQLCFLELNQNRLHHGQGFSFSLHTLIKSDISLGNH